MIVVDATALSFELDLHDVLALCDLLEVQTLPAVLRVEQPHQSAAMAAEALDRSRTVLRERGVLDSLGHVDQRLRSMILAVADPGWLVEMRRVDITQIFRMCIVGSGEGRFLVSRSGDRFLFAEVSAVDDATLLVREITTRIGTTGGAPIVPLRLPSDVLDAALASCIDEIDYTAALFGLGVDEGHARAIAATLSQFLGQTEIVANHASSANRAVLAVFDTVRGRVVSLAAPSSSGERWTSMSPGDDHAVVSAIRQLAHNLPEGDR